jgi:hypothetical protein
VEAGFPIGGALAAALADHRDRFNAAVGQARRTYVDFDLPTLDHQIRGPLGQIVEACDRVSSGSGSRVLAALFEPVVELVGQHRLGGGSHDGLVTSLSRLAHLLVDEPGVVFVSLANAIIHLDRYDAPTDQWLNRVETAATCGNTTTTLRAGQVAAWTLGLTHFRESALGVASTLSSEALWAALGVTPNLSMPEALKQLQDDRWWRPGRSPSTEPAVAHLVGGFRGFGGPFLAPPRVGTFNGQIVVCSADEAWTLHADAWGATLTRTDARDIALTASNSAVVPPELRPSSVAAVPDITALTIATSYQVLVVEPGR